MFFYDYKAGDQVWLKRKYFKPGESKKLLPRKDGPWSVVKKLPNGVNFEIVCPKSKNTKIVHHNRLSPVSGSSRKNSNGKVPIRNPIKKPTTDLPAYEGSSEDNSSSDEDIDVDTNNDPAPEAAQERRYPQRVRVQRQIEGAVPWDQVSDEGSSSEENSL